MRNLAIAAAVALTGLSWASPAMAGGGQEVTQAVEMCRAEAAARAGVSEVDVHLDRVNPRARRVRVDLDVWKEGQLTNVRCDVRRAESLEISAINLPAQDEAVTTLSAAE